MSKRWIDRELKPKVQDILQRTEDYHISYYAADTFSGPSLHFHRRALGLIKPIKNAERLELTYAVLTSWGMHRMGTKGSKMQPFPIFRSSLYPLLPAIAKLRKKSFYKIEENDWNNMEKVFKGINTM
jgi:hypothetical protein